MNPIKILNNMQIKTNLLRTISRLNGEIELLEEFKNTPGLKCVITRPKYNSVDSYSDLRMPISQLNLIVEMISKSQEDLREKIKIEEAKLEKIIIS